jgi:hypothetical protein
LTARGREAGQPLAGKGDAMAEVTAQTVRDEVAEWLAANWDPERPLLEWRNLLADTGWGCPTWPKEFYRA